MSEKAAFGSWLKDRRGVLDLTQDELAHSVDCSLTLIRKLEAGKRRPSKQIAELLAARLDIPADERSDFVRFARSRNAYFSLDEKSPWRALRHQLTNLPIPPTSLFGREQEIADVVHRVVYDRARLLTLTGPPGIGKTRLAIECAENLLDHFDDGVYFIALAPLRDPDLVLPTIARALDVKPIVAQSYLKALTDYLADKRMLLLLDNFEQVVGAAPLISEMLTSCPWLHVLVTSRASLHIRAERQFRVAPLALPPRGSNDDPNRLLESPAIQLFVDRAVAVEPSFSLSRDYGSAIAQVCWRLDGIPLAIELAATRSGALPPNDLLAQIERRLTLAERAGDLPPRHQTLRNAIEWSYDLLDAKTRTLFARLAIFLGGWTIEMVNAICGQGIAESELMRELSTLSDSSLLTKEKVSDGELRWSMLETIREYAAECLAKSKQTEEMAKRHAEFFLAFAESAAPHLSDQDQVAWLNKLDPDHGNLHAAVEWAIDHGEAELALRLGVALHTYWYKQGWLHEGRRWLKRALALSASETVVPSLRQSALRSAAFLAWAHADFAEAEKLAEESHALALEIGDRKAMADALHVLANVAVDRADYSRAIALYQQNLERWRELGDKARMASTLNNLGRMAYYRGDAALAIRCHDEGLAMQRELGDHFGIAAALNNLGGALADNSQDLDRATALLQESLSLSREPGTKYFLIPFTLAHLGRVALYSGDLERAQTTLEEGLKVAREAQSRTGRAFALLFLAQLELQRNNLPQAASLLQEGLELQRQFEDKGAGLRYLATMAALFCAQRQAVGAATLIGSIAGLSESADVRLPPLPLKQHDATISRTREQLDEQTFSAAFASGKAMTLAQAFDYAAG